MNAVVQINKNSDVSIASSALLIDLNIRGWTGVKKDREVSDEVSNDKGATTTNAGSYQKNLLAGSEELASINKYAMLIRQWHAHKTLPWSDSGTRLLPAVNLIEYMAELSQHETEYNDRVNLFVQEYNLLVQAAQFRLGNLFKHDDYPDPSSIPSKFALRYSVFPLPEAGDFRVDIGNQGLRELREEFELAQERRINEAMGEVRERIKTSLTKISRQLRVEADGSKGRIHDSTLEAALELAGALDSFNLTRDPELIALKREMESVLGGYDVKDLRKDDVVRGYAKEEVDSLLSKFNF